MTDSVAYILGCYPEPSETFIRREVEGLRRLGVRVCVMSLRTPRAREPGVVYRSRLLSFGTIVALACMLLRPGETLRAAAIAVKLRHRPLEMLKACRNIAAATQFVRAMRKLGIERLHAHFANMPATVGLMIVAMTGAAFSFTAHARDIYVAPTLLREKAETASVVTTCTAANVWLLRDLLPDLPDEHTQLVYHGVDTTAFSPADSPVADPPIVIAVGRLIEKKGFDVLIDACRGLSREGVAFACRIIGEGPLRPALERQIADNALTGSVKLAGHKLPAELIEEYRRATVCAQPCVVAADGDHDGLPNVLLEAAACGTPIVSTPVGGVRELIRPDETGLLVPERDASALAEAIGRILKDTELRGRLSNAARSEVERRFSVDANVLRLADVLQFGAASDEEPTTAV